MEWHNYLTYTRAVNKGESISEFFRVMINCHLEEAKALQCKTDMPFLVQLAGPLDLEVGDLGGLLKVGGWTYLAKTETDIAVLKLAGVPCRCVVDLRTDTYLYDVGET